MSNVQIPNLPAAVALTGTEQMEAVQAGSSVRVTTSQIASLASPFAGNPLPVAMGGTGTGTAFTVGSIVFAGASGVYSQNNANLFWNDSSLRLGVGNNSPAYSLDITGTFRATGNSLVGGTLGVTGATTLSNTLGVTGATTLSNTLGVTGAATFSSTLGVTGALTLGNPTTAQGVLNLSGATSGTVTIQGAAAAGTWTFTLPTTGGTSGYILTTNGLGVASWTSPAALGIDIDVGSTAITGGTSGRVLYDNAGVVGEYTTVPLSVGGTNANLTASNGGIFYSTATAGAILSGTVTANRVLLSGSSAAPSWSTATYPATTTINQLLYSSAANTVAGLATTNGGILNANSSGVPSMTVAPVLGVAGTSSGSIGLSGITSGVVTIQTAAAAGTWSLTLPTTGGTSNYALTTNGSGVTSWSQISLSAGVTGTLPVTNGGTGASIAGIAAFNNITGYTAAGSTGTTSTNLVFSVSPTLTYLALAAGTATAGQSPLKFTGGTNLTAAEAGAVEYDGTCYYATPNAGNRGALSTEHFVVLTSSNTLTNSTAAQPLFDGGGGPANGSLTLPTGTYFFQLLWDISGLSASAHTLSLTFSGTATIGAIKYQGSSTDSTAVIVVGSAATATQIGTAGTTSTTSRVIISGVFTVTVAGTIIPQITQGTASAAATVLIGSHFRCHSVGASNVATVGNWS